LIDNTFTVTGQIDVGDSIRGMFNFNTLNSGAANVGGLTGNNEWTGVFQVQALTKVALGGGLYSFTFGADPAFAANLCGGAAGCASGFVPGPGAMFVFFEGSPNNVAQDFDDPAPATPPAGPDDGAPGSPNPADVGTGLTATEEAFIATGTDGTWFWTLGFSGPGGTAGPGEGILTITTVPGFDNVLGAFSMTTATAGAISNMCVSLLGAGSFTGTVTATTPCLFGPTQFAATVTDKGVSDLDTPFELSSDLTLSFNAIPEPTTLSLLGFGLFGLAFGMRRRSKKQA
jgi:hypothetical protein